MLTLEPLNDQDPPRNGPASLDHETLIGLFPASLLVD